MNRFVWIVLFFIANFNYAHSKIVTAPIGYPKYGADNRSPQVKCSKKDFSKHLGPVRDQGASGNCFAYQAADLLNYALKIKPPSQVSALELAMRYHIFPNKNTTADVNLNAFINQALSTTGVNLKLQPDPYAGATIFTENSDYDLSLQARMNYGGTGNFTVKLVNENDFLCEAKGFDDIASQEGEDPIGDSMKFALAYADKEKNSCDSRTDVTSNSIQDVNKVIYSSMVNSCKKIKISKFINVKLTRIPKVSDLRYDDKISKYEIDKSLDGDQIVGINYHPAFMMVDDPGMHSRHGSSIVGREFKDGQCWYKLRNSWGDSCAPYKTQISSGTADIRCENGGSIWIKEDQLLPHIYDIINAN